MKTIPRILSILVICSLLVACAPQPAATSSATPPEETLEPTSEPVMISPVVEQLAQDPLFVIDTLTLQKLLEQKDPYATAYVSAAEDLIHQNPDWQDKTMADFDMSVMMLSGEGTQANEGQLYATIEGQTWILGRYREGVGIEPIVEPVVATQGNRGPRLKYGNTTLLEVATVNNVKGVKGFRVDGSAVFSGESSLTETGITQKQQVQAAMLPVVLPAEMEIATTQYADKQLRGLNDSGYLVAAYDFDRKEWQVTIPVYADWMAGHVEGLEGVWENQAAYLVKEMADGRTIKVFEFADNEWRPSYASMDLFVREDKTFDLETAQKTMFMRMGPVADVDGQPAMSVNMEDYQRFAERAKEIWNSLDKTILFRTCFNSMSGGTHFDLSASKSFDLTILDDDYENPYFDSGQWQVIGWARNPVGAESVFVLATADGPVALLNVGDVGYIHTYRPSDSIEEGVMELANQTSTQFGTSDVILLLLDLSINPRFIGKVNTEKAELMRAYIRGMGIDGHKIAAMMFGDISAQRKALSFMFEHYPAPIYDFDGD